MKVLVLAPHPDDESIGCGGAACLHSQAGDSVVAVYLTSGETGLKHFSRDEAWRIRESEARQAAEILGIKELHFLHGTDWSVAQEVSKLAAALRPLLAAERPEVVYLPHVREWHPDHKAATPILEEALADSGVKRVRLRAYEIWTPLSEFQHLENIDSVMARKILAIRAHRSQLDQLSYADAIQGLNRYRGALSCKCRYAEVFQESTLG
jgi:LmbE family N-acetylglucosaminyl deacetylase